MSLVEVSGGAVTTIRLVNPPLNLVTVELTRQLDRVLAMVADDPGVRAVVVAGGERAFCAGSDVSEFEGLRGRALEGKVVLEKAVYRRLAELGMPTIAACEGDALGGGLELAICCDLRVVSEKARFGMPEVGLGVIPGSGGTQRLPRLVGLGMAKELILTGRIIDAGTAASIGLVTRVVGPGQAETSAREMAEGIAGKGPIAVREAKRLVDLAFDLSLDDGLLAETEASGRVFDTDDMVEGARAFLDKREPDFDGR
ncbi:MAG TPA: enoyl-CoA hydratase-related protein [Acidimicrobiia bacterium]|nr:enoyl-CoA hydratase-related protein [Acidimicrobiia bacterium]